MSPGCTKSGMMVTAKESKMVAEARKREAEEFYRRQQWVAAACAFGEASEAARLALVENPDLFVSLSKNLAAAALRSGDASRAEAACCEALALKPHDLKALYRRGVARLELRRFDEAKADLKAVIATAQDVKSKGAAETALKQLEASEREPPPASIVCSKEPIVARPKYETVPRPSKLEVLPKRLKPGFLLERARKVAASRVQIKPVEQVRTADIKIGPELPLVEGDHAAVKMLGQDSVMPAPPSVFNVPGAGTRPELVCADTMSSSVEPFAALAASLAAQLDVARGWRDNALQEQAQDLVCAAIESCNRALTITKPAIERCHAAACNDWGSYPRHDSSIAASQLRARSTALANVAARCCLVRGSCETSRLIASTSPAMNLDNAKRRGLKADATAALDYCRFWWENHRDHEQLAREAYLVRALAWRDDKALLEALSDALKALSLNPWQQDAIDLVDDLVARLELKPETVFAGDNKTKKRYFLRHRVDNGSIIISSVRPGEKVRSTIRPSMSARCVEAALERRAMHDTVDDLWAPAPEEMLQSSPVGEGSRGGQLQVVVFRNDGRWSGGIILRVSRACGSALLSTEAAAKLGILRTERAYSYSMFLRDGQEASPLVSTLPNFAWLAISPDDIFTDADGCPRRDPRSGYRPPADPVNVGRSWRLPDPAIRRQHLHWLVAGRLGAASCLDDAVDDLSRGVAVVVRDVHLAPGVTSAMRAATDAAGCVRYDDEWWCGEDEDVAPRGLFAGTEPASRSSPTRLGPTTCLWRTIEDKLSHEASFGAVSNAFARETLRGDILPVRFDEAAVVLAQVSGRSRFIVFDPLYHPALYAYPSHHPLRHFSRLGDLSGINTSTFPLSAELRGLEVDLGPGDALCLPRGWWRQEQTVGDTPAVVVEIVFSAQTRVQSPDLIQGPDLALAATCIERYAAKQIGKRQVASFINRLRTEIVDSGWCIWPKAQLDDAPDITEESKDDRRLLLTIRAALGSLLGPDAVEHYATHYLSAPRWAGLATLSELDADRQANRAAALRRRLSSSNAPLSHLVTTSLEALSLETASLSLVKVAHHDAMTTPSGNTYQTPDSEDEAEDAPIVIDITSKHLGNADFSATNAVQ